MSEAESKEESQDNLRLLLKSLEDKLYLTSKALTKSENECNNLKKYNSDLIKQIDITNSKLNALLNVCDTLKPKKEVQTECTFNDDQRICPFCKNKLPTSRSTLLGGGSASGKKLSDEIKEWANDALKACDNQNYEDYIYDSKSKPYYNLSTGCYYYPEQKLYFDTKTKKFFQCEEETKTYKAYPVMDQKQRLFSSDSIVNEKLKLNSNEANKKQDINENEEGEILSDDSENDHDFVNNQDNSRIAFDHTPSDCDIALADNDELESACLRIIVRKSTTLEEGSLLLITCKGAVVGKDADCDVQILDELVSRKHANVVYDKQLKAYLIKDLDSKNGIYINGKRIESNSDYFELKHDDILTLGGCELLIHYHKGRDVTCENCEPGCVQAALKLNVKSVYEEACSSEEERKNKLKQLKKKYGIGEYDNFQFNPNYSDRADKRRKLKGSDNPYEKTAEGTALDKPLDDCNKGFSMLKKLGWSQGQGLGKKAKGQTEPLPIDPLEDRVGFGYAKS